MNKERKFIALFGSVFAIVSLMPCAFFIWLSGCPVGRNPAFTLATMFSFTVACFAFCIGAWLADSAIEEAKRKQQYKEMLDELKKR